MTAENNPYWRFFLGIFALSWKQLIEVKSMTYSGVGASNSGSENSGYGGTGYGDSDDNPYGSKEADQGNFEDGDRENVYDRSNLGDNAWTDTAADPNPQLEL